MSQNYFVYNNKKYYSGTLIYVNWANYVTRSLCKTLAKFCEFQNDKNSYIFEIDGMKHSRSTIDFYNILLGIYGEEKPRNYTETRVKRGTFKDELEIDGLLFAWIWYIIIMAAAIIFHDRILIWCATSFIFFSYRNKKLKEAGYK